MWNIIDIKPLTWANIWKSEQTHTDIDIHQQTRECHLNYEYTDRWSHVQLFLFSSSPLCRLWSNQRKLYDWITPVINVFDSSQREYLQVMKFPNYPNTDHDNCFYNILSFDIMNPFCDRCWYIKHMINGTYILLEILGVKALGNFENCVITFRLKYLGGTPNLQMDKTQNEKTKQRMRSMIFS